MKTFQKITVAGVEFGVTGRTRRMGEPGRRYTTQVYSAYDLQSKVTIADAFTLASLKKRIARKLSP